MMQLTALDPMQMDLLKNIAGIDEFDDNAAFNLRLNGATVMKNVTENVKIAPKSDKSGIDIYVKAGTKGENVHIPVILSASGLKETVFNDFHIGEGADIIIVAGCGIHACGEEEQEHSGIHSFYLEKNAHVKYVEKHYGNGDAPSKRIMNPTTFVELGEGSFMEMDTVQLGGVDETERVTTAILGKDARLVISEKIMTSAEQIAKTKFTVDLNGDGSSAHVMSRSVAKEKSYQEFISNVRGNALCKAHTECDAIVMDNAKVLSSPIVVANCVDAELVHEAAIGKIAGEQIIKLMTLGLSEKEAEEKIVNGFLK